MYLIVVQRNYFNESMCENSLKERLALPDFDPGISHIRVTALPLSYVAPDRLYTTRSADSTNYDANLVRQA